MNHVSGLKIILKAKTTSETKAPTTSTPPAGLSRKECRSPAAFRWSLVATAPDPLLSVQCYKQSTWIMGWPKAIHIHPAQVGWSWNSIKSSGICQMFHPIYRISQYISQVFHTRSNQFPAQLDQISNFPTVSSQMTIWLLNTSPWTDPPLLSSVNHLFLWAIYSMAM